MTKNIIHVTAFLVTLIGAVPDTVVRADVYRYAVTSTSDKTDFPNYVISGDKLILEKQRSPYLVKKDVLIAEDGELQIEPGVTLLFAPTVGITVKGILTAKVINNSMLYPIRFT